MTEQATCPVCDSVLKRCDSVWHEGGPRSTHSPDGETAPTASDTDACSPDAALSATEGSAATYKDAAWIGRNRLLDIAEMVVDGRTRGEIHLALIDAAYSALSESPDGGSDFPMSVERGCGASGKEAAHDSLGQPARLRDVEARELLRRFPPDPPTVTLCTSESEQAPMMAKPSGEGDASPPDPDTPQGRSDAPVSFDISPSTAAAWIGRNALLDIAGMCGEGVPVAEIDAVAMERAHAVLEALEVTE